MAAQYPSNLVTTTQLPDTRTNNTATATAHVSDHNNIADELIAIETELGTLPKGGYANVKTALEQGLSSADMAYLGLRALGATGLPVAATMPMETDVASVITLTANRLVGAACMVSKAVTITSIRIRTTTAVAGSTVYNGAFLYSMDSSGNWNYIIDNGANDATQFNATGLKSWTVASTVLSPGVVYFPAIVTGLTGVGVVGQNGQQNSAEAVYWRCGGKVSVSTRQNAQIVTANLAGITQMPLIWMQ